MVQKYTPPSSAAPPPVGGNGPPVFQPPIGSPPNGNSRPNGRNGGNDMHDNNGCGCKVEYWQCNQGLTEVITDEAGCPVDQKFCKTQVGNTVVVGAGAAFTITVTAANFTEARVTGLVMNAGDPAALLGSSVDFLSLVDVNSIAIQGTESLGGGLVTAARYAADANGSGGCGGKGTGQSYPGRLGTTGGNLVIQGTNNSAVTLRINATADVNAVR